MLRYHYSDAEMIDVGDGNRAFGQAVTKSSTASSAVNDGFIARVSDLASRPPTAALQRRALGAQRPPRERHAVVVAL